MVLLTMSVCRAIMQGCKRLFDANCDRDKPSVASRARVNAALYDANRGRARFGSRHTPATMRATDLTGQAAAHPSRCGPSEPRRGSVLSCRGMKEASADRAALIVEGGAMRGIFAVGVLRRFAEQGFFPFDFCIGVSSGAFALALARLDRSDLAFKTFTAWATEGDFVSFRRFARGGHLLDIDELGRRLAPELEGRSRLAWPSPFFVCVTDVGTGEPRYLEADDSNVLDLLRATVALPWLYRDFPRIGGRPCTDGGASDAIPVAEALARGATRLVVIRSRPRHYVKRDTWAHRLVRWKLRQHPALRAAMRGRAARFQEVVRLMRRPPPGVQVLEVCPPPDFSLGRFGRDPARLDRGYRAGLDAGTHAIAAWALPLRTD